MAIDFAYRRHAVRQLPTAIGVYVLCDLDAVPIYVGSSRDGIRRRVARHLTSARSDIIANRQIDIWEVAYVWAYPTASVAEIKILEGRLYHYFHPKSELVNGSVPPKPPRGPTPKPTSIIQVTSDKEIADRRDPTQRLPRQAAHYAQIVGHFLAVKNSKQIARAMNAHFRRLETYHKTLLGIATEQPDDEEESG